MPIYEYDCETCGARFDKLVFLTAQPKPVDCPECSSDQVSKRLSLIAVCFGVERRGHSLFGCLHDQHLRDDPLAGRAPAGRAGRSYAPAFALRLDG